MTTFNTKLEINGKAKLAFVLAVTNVNKSVRIPHELADVVFSMLPKQQIVKEEDIFSHHRAALVKIADQMEKHPAVYQPMYTGSPIMGGNINLDYVQFDAQNKADALVKFLDFMNEHCEMNIVFDFYYHDDWAHGNNIKWEEWEWEEWDINWEDWLMWDISQPDCSRSFMHVGKYEIEHHKTCVPDEQGNFDCSDCNEHRPKKAKFSPEDFPGRVWYPVQFQF